MAVTAPSQPQADRALALATEIATSMAGVDVAAAQLAAEALIDAREALLTAEAAAEQAKAAAQAAAATLTSYGVTEVDISAALGISRQTLRRWTGKQE